MAAFLLACRAWQHLCFLGVCFCPPFCGAICCPFWTPSVNEWPPFHSISVLAVGFQLSIRSGAGVCNLGGLLNCTRSGFVPRPFGVSSEDAVFLRYAFAQQRIPQRIPDPSSVPLVEFVQRLVGCHHPEQHSNLPARSDPAAGTRCLS